MVEVSVSVGLAPGVLDEERADSTAGVAAAETPLAGASALSAAEEVSVGPAGTSAAWLLKAGALESDESMDQYLVKSAAGTSLVEAAAVEVAFVGVLAIGDSAMSASDADSVGVSLAGAVTAEVLPAAVVSGVVPVEAACEAAGFGGATLVVLLGLWTGCVVVAAEFVLAVG